MNVLDSFDLSLNETLRTKVHKKQTSFGLLRLLLLLLLLHDERRRVVSLNRKSTRSTVYLQSVYFHTDATQSASARFGGDPFTNLRYVYCIAYH